MCTNSWKSIFAGTIKFGCGGKSLGGHLCSDESEATPYSGEMVTKDWDNPEQRAKMMKLHTTEEIERRFRKVFNRDMTPEERHAFFMPDGEKEPFVLTKRPL